MGQDKDTWIKKVESAGFSILEKVIEPDEIAALIGSIEKEKVKNTSGESARGSYAMRNLLAVPAVKRLAESMPIRALVEEILGPKALAARGLLFDKTPAANWKVTWHQDLLITVRERREVNGYGPWSVKAGVPHVQPPAKVLEKMVTVRLHLDDCGEDNGPLRVLPGSHRAGILAGEQIDAWRDSHDATTCQVPRGGVLVMRPLLLHASSAASKPAHRRVIHLEFAAQPLERGLEWNG